MIVDLPPMDDYEATRKAFRLDVPPDFNFGFDVIDRRARERDKVAFLYVDGAGDTITEHRFSDLSRASNRFVHALAGLGVEKGDGALVMIPRVPAFYEVIVGCCKAGVVAMPGTNLLTSKDIAYRVQRAKARVAIVTEEHVRKVEAIRDQCPTLERLIVIGEPGRPATTIGDGWTDYHTACAPASDELSREGVAPTTARDLMLLYFTSGTTAYPKMVPRDMSYALAHAITGTYWMDLREDDIHWTLTDTGWAKAAWGLLFPPWLAGATTVLHRGLPKMDAKLHLRLLGKLGVTTFCAPPTVYRLFAQLDLSGYDLSSVRHSLSAGEPLNPEAIRVWKEATGTVPHDGYGQTETVNLVANYPGMEVRPGSMGKPCPGMDVHIVDAKGQEVAEGEVGEIAVHLGEASRDGDDWPPGLFRGYWDDEDTNARVFRHGHYYTGDTATRDADGYFWFVGRSDDIITSAGYRISPFEVESALQEHEAIVESAVVADPDELRGEIVHAYVVLAAGHEPSDELASQIQTFVKEHTAPYKYPRKITFRDELPKTISGKIRRVELRAESKT